MKQTKTFCDICKTEAECDSVKVPVIFHTEQTEGRSCKPYFSESTIDICRECAVKAFRLHGRGAQGINEYWIEDMSDKVAVDRNGKRISYAVDDGDKVIPISEYEKIVKQKARAEFAEKLEDILMIKSTDGAALIEKADLDNLLKQYKNKEGETSYD